MLHGKFSLILGQWGLWSSSKYFLLAWLPAQIHRNLHKFTCHAPMTYVYMWISKGIKQTFDLFRQHLYINIWKLWTDKKLRSIYKMTENPVKSIKLDHIQHFITEFEALTGTQTKPTWRVCQCIHDLLVEQELGICGILRAGKSTH